MSTLLTPAISADAEEAMLRLRVGTSTRVLLGVCGAGAVVVTLAWSHTMWHVLALWYSVMLLSQAGRIWTEIYAAQVTSGRPLQQRLTFAAWSAFSSGLVQAASLLFFPSEDGFEQSLHTLILLVMSTGAVVYTAGHPRTYYPYMAPIVMALVLAWWIGSTAAAERPWLAAGFGVLILVYGANLVGYARDTWAMFVNAAAMRHQEALQNQRLAAAVNAAEAASHAKTRFLAAASHDLRQPIHTIALLAGVLKLRHRDDASAEVVTLLDSVVQSLSHQLDDLLDISKLDAGVVKVTAQPLLLQRFLRRRLDEVGNEARAKGLSLHLEIDDDLCVFTDPHLLERVLRNLLDNAVKFTHQGSVTLRLRREGGNALIEVADTGSGIPPGQQNEVFQEFVQLHNPERDRSKGMGLGLSIVDRLCRLLSIDLQLRSAQGQGTVFQLRLPLLTATTHRQGDHGATQPPPPALGLNVLVVDDEATVRQATAWLLSEIGCSCMAVEDRATALTAVRAQRPDVALVDYRLRDGDDGISVVQALREQIPGLPAAIVSGDIGPEQLQAVEAARLRLLHKPLSPQLLQMELHLAVRQQEGAHAPA